MDDTVLARLRAETEALRAQGLYKTERVLASAQQAEVRLESGVEVVNLCANNYLGLANHPGVVAAAAETLRKHGYGMASVRFICGTQTVHRELEERLSRFLGTEDTILYSSCFDANGGLFETI
ncbi:MAG: aminotransferase class I/II-fold pyridoxal phosphate-dependent enzyme, partial [Steroidobacterales bacterium]